MMKRINILTLALTLVLGCWAGSASARLLPADDALLVPYYKVSSNLATITGVQNIGSGTTASIINVAVYDADGQAVARDYICLGPNEFGFIVLQDAKPTAVDTDWGIRFSAAGDGIDKEGFMTLAYGGTKNSCSDGAGTTASTASSVVVAWAILQDVGSGFFATEIPVVQVGWEAAQTTGSAAKDLQPYCYLTTDTTKTQSYNELVGTPPTSCQENYTFVASGAYCYLNTDQTRAIVENQLNAAKTGCADEFTHTFVPANTKLPAIPALGPRADVSCDSASDCPGLAYNTSDTTVDTIGARFDVASANSSASNVYLWLDTAPLDGRKATVSAICEDGMSKKKEITINDHVTMINPSGMGCSGRGVLELELPERASADDKCYASGDTNKAAVSQALDDRNNKCYSFTFSSNIDNSDPATPGCYRSGDTAKTRVAEAENTNTSNVATSCKSFTYVKDVTADSPSGYMFSHISQANEHYRMNFSGYEK